ncbi:MAG: UDP-4-amino-4,6-dideoxy-N-acetyl-beta-L-altrosamine transaminase [Candidatus Muirbacterium halophilum]|nr:UDP-4-amino-4,6-dideoxy-N-acetyl-beta-L-altrosamine transaminase [Candidatus Muirbacterium halophilum]
MEFLSYGKQWIDEDDIKSVIDVLKSDYLTQGPYIKKMEDEICQITQAKYCVAVSNGTAALHLAVMALEIEKGSEGITSPITFVASANSMVYSEIIPVFADIDKKDYNISPSEIERKISKKTKLIIPVHFAGQPAKMKEIKEIANKNKLYIIEDAAHAIGSNYEDGTPVGNCNYSDMTVFSFHPVKTITCGEGGAITTNNKEIYDKLILLRTHGITKDFSKFKYENEINPWFYEMQLLGYNYRITDIQASLAVSQLRKLDRFKKRRREIVKKYNNAFKEIPYIVTPFERESLDSCFHLYVILIDFKQIGVSRKQIIELLKNKNIGCQVLYIPVHLQPYYQEKYNYKLGDYPCAENYYKHCLALPLYPKMTDSDVTYVIGNLVNIIHQ